MLPFDISPRRAYRQIPKAEGIGGAKIVRTRLGTPEYGHVQLSVKRLDRGKGFEFVDDATERYAIPARLLFAIETGTLRAAQVGLWGFPLADFGVTVLDGSYHNVDSTNYVFEEVAELALFQAMLDSQPSLLEAHTTLTLNAPQNFQPIIIAHLTKHRALLVSTPGSSHPIVARIPISEASHFLEVFAAMTNGTGTYSATFPEFSGEPESPTWRYFCSVCARDMVIPLVRGSPITERCLICGTPFEPPDFAVPVRRT
jgi:elongation factor G